MKYYVLRICGDVEPQLYGPYSSWNLRDEQARTLRKLGEEHGIFWLDATDAKNITVGAYSAAGLEGGGE